MGEGIYGSLTCDQKMLYALLRQKCSDSDKTDDLGRKYLIYPRAAMMDALNLAKNTVSKAMRELVKANLIHDEPQGEKVPNRIYVPHVCGLDVKEFIMIPVSLYNSGAERLHSEERMILCFLCHKYRMMPAHELNFYKNGLPSVVCSRKELEPVLSLGRFGVSSAIKNLKELGFIEVEPRGPYSSVISYDLSAL
jgi:predicted transcriptional regulator